MIWSLKTFGQNENIKISTLILSIREKNHKLRSLCNDNDRFKNVNMKCLTYTGCAKKRKTF